MTNQREITLGVIGVLDSMASIPAIAWPNVDFDPSAIDEYIAVYMLPAESEADTMGDDTLIGLIQTSVYIRDGKGIIDALTYTDLIRAEFAKGLEITNGTTKFRITKTPWDAPILIEDGWCQIPVTIPYKTYGVVIPAPTTTPAPAPSLLTLNAPDEFLEITTGDYLEI